MSEMAHLKWEGMGTQLEVIVGPSDQGENPERAAQEVRELWNQFALTGSRFDSDSEIERLNRNPSEKVKISPMLERMLRSALKAAEDSDGLLDPTLSPQLRDIGYAESWDDKRHLEIQDALQLNPPQRTGKPNPDSRWSEIEMGDGWVRRPAGLELEIGGTGKGLASDMAAEMLGDRFRYWTVNCGGDLRSGGSKHFSQEVEIRHPQTSEIIGELWLSGAIATSGITRRIWLDTEGNPMHHLLDPKSGMPVWSGLLQVSAAAPTCAEAERLASQALMQGKDKARKLLSNYGGIIVDQHGNTEQIEGRPRISAKQLKEVYA